MEKIKNMSKKEKITAGALIVGILTLIVVFIFIFASPGDRPDKIENNQDFEIDTSTLVLPSVYAAFMNGGNSYKSSFLHDLYINDEITKTYHKYFGEPFLKSLTVKSTKDGRDVEIVPGKEKILVFTMAEDDATIRLLDDYAYLGALAKDIDAYELYIINTNKNTMDRFVDEIDGYLYVTPITDAANFLSLYPDEFVLYVDKNNNIEGITSLLPVDQLSLGGAYIFKSTQSSHSYIEYFDEWYADPIAAHEKYIELQYSENNDLKFESFSQLNNDLILNFHDINDALLNTSNLTTSDISYNRNYLVTSMHSSGDRTYKVIQDNSGGLYVDVSNFEYNFVINLSDFDTVSIYGKNQDEISAFMFWRNNIKVYIESNKTWNKQEVLNIVGNFPDNTSNTAE